MAGQFIRSEGYRNIIKVSNGQEITLHVGHRTRKDAVATGDYIHFYFTKEGHAENIQRLEN